jgi:hypothetical protein
MAKQKKAKRTKSSTVSQKKSIAKKPTQKKRSSAKSNSSSLSPTPKLLMQSDASVIAIPEPSPKPKSAIHSETYRFNEDFIKGVVVGLVIAFILVAGYVLLYY